MALASANPSSGGVTLECAIPSFERATLEVFDVRGVRIRGLVDGPVPPGIHRVTWDGADATGRLTPPGLYLTRLRVGAETRSIKLIRGR